MRLCRRSRKHRRRPDSALIDGYRRRPHPVLAARGGVLDGLEPAAVFQAFEELAAIPRPSGHMEG